MNGECKKHKISEMDLHPEGGMYVCRYCGHTEIIENEEEDEDE